MKLRIVVGIVVLAVSFGARAQTIGPFVSVLPQGQCGRSNVLAFYAMTRTGDIISQDEGQVWRLERNIFDEAGVSGSDEQVVAFAHQSPTSPSQCAMTASGEYFLQSYSGDRLWTHEGNIGAIAERPALGQFVALTVNGSYMYDPADGRQHALTDQGEWYRKLRNDQWRYVGNITDWSGVIPTEKRSLGGLKAIHNQ